MNLTLPLFLTQNLGFFHSNDWTVNTLMRIINIYLREKEDVFIFHYYPDVPDDNIMESIIKNIGSRDQFLFMCFNGTKYRWPPEFNKPQVIIMFMEYAKITYTDILKSFLRSVLKNFHKNLRVIAIIQHHKFLRDGDASIFLERLWNFNIRNVIIVNSIETDYSTPGLKIFHWCANSDFKPKFAEINKGNIRTITVNMKDGSTALDQALTANKLLLSNIEHIMKHFLNVSVLITPPYVMRNEEKKFYSKEYQNLTTDELEGIEVYIVKEFSRLYNLSGFFIIHPSEMIGIDEGTVENTTGSALEETIFGISDIVIGGNRADPELYKFLSPSYTYMSDAMLWYVPGWKKLPRWMNLYLIFDTTIWIYLLSTHFLLSIAAYLIDRYKNKKKTKIDFSSFMLTIWRVELSQPSSVAIQDRMRLFFAFILLYGLHVSSFYEMGLITSLHEQNYEKPISTLEEVTAENMKLCLSGISHNFYNNQGLSSELQLNLETLTLLSFSDCLDLVAEQKNYITLMPKKAAEYVLPLKYLDEDNKRKVGQIPNDIVVYPVSIYLTKASPFTNKLNFVINGLVEGGITAKWWNDIKFCKHCGTIRDESSYDPRLYRSITLRDAAGVFSVFLVFMAISSVVFISEIILFKYSSWKNKSQLGALRKPTFYQGHERSIKLRDKLYKYSR